jgi:hypothetical protein
MLVLDSAILTLPASLQLLDYSIGHVGDQLGPQIADNRRPNVYKAHGLAVLLVLALGVGVDPDAFVAKEVALERFPKIKLLSAQMIQQKNCNMT